VIISPKRGPPNILLKYKNAQRGYKKKEGKKKDKKRGALI